MIVAMVFLLYNKVLLRILVALSGVGVGLATWQYLTLSHAKLGQQGMVDAFAIVSFLIAAWLIMLTAEVVDNHYFRVFSCMCMMLGCLVSFRWLFKVDGPRLVELPGGQQGMQLVSVGWGLALLAAAVIFTLLLVRLVRDKQNAGRLPGAAQKVDQVIGSAPAGATSASGAPKQDELEAIPVDTSPITQASTSTVSSSSATSSPARTPAPVSKLVAIGGLYLGTEYDLSAGDHSIGRADADILLDKDNQVSRSHAAISIDNDGMATLRDTGSTNGTFLNNQKVTESSLAPGDVIRIGTTQFRVEGSS